MWFVPSDTKFAADDIWMWNKNNQNGISGQTREFLLAPGTTITVKGPWLSNAEHLFKETGVDLRERHAVKLKVRRIVGKELLYQDHDWVAGSIESSRAIAQEIANHDAVRVEAEIETAGGGVTFLLTPDSEIEPPRGIRA